MASARSNSRQRRSVILGFGITLGLTVTWLSLIVLIPLAGLFLKSAMLSFDQIWTILTSPRTLSALRVSFGISLGAAFINAIFGVIVAWILVRYDFQFKRVADAFVDIPFALPTAVAGIALTALYAPNGWIGSLLAPLGIKVAYTWLGIVVALTFVGLPFVVRTLQPVLENLDRETEEAAATLGAGRLRTFFSVIVPTLTPALLTGFALSFARAIGEYGSVIFISSNKVFEGQITPLLIVHRLEEYDYTGAMALAVVMLVFSFTLLIGINALERWASRFQD